MTMKTRRDCSRKDAIRFLDGTPASGSASASSCVSPCAHQNQVLPLGYPARPAPDAICGYIDDLGPFYTNTLPSNVPGVSSGRPCTNGSEGPSRTDEDDQPSIVRPLLTDEHIMINRTVQFEDTPHFIKAERLLSWYPFPTGSGSGFHESIWMCLSLAALLLSTLFLMTSFVTSFWGIMIVVPAAELEQSSNHLEVEDSLENVRTSRRWNFGLWRCCRDDGLCLGTRWPAFYSATRVFFILSLFGHALTFALMFGHTLERLLRYDICTMTTLISVCFITSSFSLITVVCFGVGWPMDFNGMSFPFKTTSTYLGYSYFFAVMTVPLTLTSASCALVDLRGSWKDYEIQRNFGMDDDDETEDEEELETSGSIHEEPGTREAFGEKEQGIREGDCTRKMDESCYTSTQTTAV